MKRLPNDDPARLEVVQNEKLLVMGVRAPRLLCDTSDRAYQTAYTSSTTGGT